METKRIKIAYQKQAHKPIYLLTTGVVECGNFKYVGRYKKEFKLFFARMHELVQDRFEDDEYDVSNYKYWDAIDIYHDYVVENWLDSISAEQIEQFANESEVAVMIERIRCEFVRAVELKWRRIFKKSDLNDPKTPKQAWQIL